MSDITDQKLRENHETRDLADYHWAQGLECAASARSEKRKLHPYSADVALAANHFTIATTLYEYLRTGRRV